jgi:S-adenosylmethionine synthetase
MFPEAKEVLANTAGDWNIGGFDADAGVTGRKIVVDAYGPTVCVGGGAFSGKDASKVDRSAAYMARKVAIEELAKAPEETADLTVRVAYAIGRALPVEVTVNGEDRPDLYERFAPASIIAELDLKKPQFEELATRGHFGSHTLWG